MSVSSSGATISEVQVPSRGELMAAVTEARRDLHTAQTTLGDAMQHIAVVERQNAEQAALLCGFAAMLGPNTLAVSFDRFDAVSGLQVVVQPDPESEQLIFYVRMQEQENDDAQTQRASAEAGPDPDEGPITDIGWRRAGAGVRAAQSAPDASEPQPIAPVESVSGPVGGAQTGLDDRQVREAAASPPWHGARVSGRASA